MNIDVSAVTPDTFRRGCRLVFVLGFVYTLPFRLFYCSSCLALVHAVRLLFFVVVDMPCTMMSG